MTQGTIKIGVLAWNQYTDWPSLCSAAVKADELGYDDIWTWDHLYPIVGSQDGPILESWLVLAAWAQATRRIRIGHLVSANTFRNPALVAKMATTLDHVSGGRAILGIGGAWFEAEHIAYGFEYGHSPGERLQWLEEAVSIMRGMLDGSEPSGDRYYAARAVRNDPPPLQRHLPLLVGGGGEKKTLRIVARYADACNVAGSVESVKGKDQILRRHCAEVGRIESEIERTVSMGVCIIRDSESEARRVLAETFAGQGGASPGQPPMAGTTEQVAEMLRPYLAIGFRHFIVGFPAPFDGESLQRLIGEVKPLLEAGPNMKVGNENVAT